MFATTMSLNSTNVRNAISLAWHRINLTVTSALAPARAVDKAGDVYAFAAPAPVR